MAEECNHPIRIGDMCGRCGCEIKDKNEELFTLLHNNTSVLLNKTEAERVNEEMYDSITKNRKLVLLLDLDQTVIHTSVSGRFGAYFHELKKEEMNFSCGGSAGENKTSTGEGGSGDVSKNIRSPEKGRKAVCLEERKERAVREVQEVKIEGFSYYVKPRDGLTEFLLEVSKYYEIHIYTMGNKAYANAVVGLLDPGRTLFGNRIVTRDDNFGCFEKDIKRLFPTNSKHVVILDDRPDVWGFIDRLYPIRPYTFFQSEDINSPEILQGKKSLKKEEASGGVTGKKDLMRRIERECISTYFDSELEKVLAGLVEVHREFFTGRENTAEILREMTGVFRGCVGSIITPAKEFTCYLSKLFLQHGGSISADPSASSVTHLICSSGTPVRIKGTARRLQSIKCVRDAWICESIFLLKRQNEDDFLLSTAHMERISTPEEYSESDENAYEKDRVSTLDVESSDDSLYRQIVEGE
ncbi:RNA polymerase II subunit A C-terminal domain phosphatase [Nematocida major]|uniref:RNA polymerase II subunit A C-terminal domain phosphatase n=1 Tax=Nematocida major TaxID=1912982 RepID=UPI002007D6B0|nr:RNA polymerase II subunit A C-terminal domain phosphatase [Nematocida major]KAH9387278.1 RNA polymerase II subunit A C-terminal domain phosphatase [Nematocida major]